MEKICIDNSSIDPDEPHGHGDVLGETEVNFGRLTELSWRVDVPGGTNEPSGCICIHLSLIRAAPHSFSKHSPYRSEIDC